MKRTSWMKSRRALLLLFAVGQLLTLAGCTALATLAWVAMPNDVKADYSGLVGKRVVVVCHPVVELQYANANVSQDIARRVGELLEKKTNHKIKVVDQHEVAEWVDENDWKDYAQIGEALRADMVVGIDLERFTLNSGPTLYQGAGIAHLTVYEVGHGNKQVWEKAMQEVLFPPNTGIPTTEKTEPEFRNQFVGILADHIARHFYDHDSRVDFASDSTALHP